MNEIQIYKNFLEKCQKEGLTIWADPNLEKDKGTTGHWHGNDHISVLRVNISQARCINRLSKDFEISQFVEESLDPSFELNTLLHEYGHWNLRHPSDPESSIKFEQEVEAWNRGEEVARELGLEEFQKYHQQKESALKTYKEGLKI